MTKEDEEKQILYEVFRKCLPDAVEIEMHHIDHCVYECVKEIIKAIDEGDIDKWQRIFKTMS